MSTAHSQESRPDQSAKRRKRKDRSVSRAPEPKNIVSGAGQPLDMSVRRELEEQLGHDFGRVRLHTDRDAGALTEMLGADAVAVGQDIFFREGAYRPGTADGRRLLAHELLHTVQNPHGLGALRAGRDLGAVSLPQQATEREAESAAQESVREGEPATAVEEGRATPGWLRYATVDGDRNRLEQIDPATLVDRLANSVVRSLRGDPEDRSKRTRMQLARLPEELQDAVLDRLEARLLSSEHERVLDLVDEIEIDEETDEQLEQSSLDAPAVESDLFEEVSFERERERQSADERQEETDRPQVAPGPEKEQTGTGGAAGSTPQNGGTREDGTTPQGGEAPRGGTAPRGGEQAQEPGGSGGGGADGGGAAQAPEARQPASTPGGTASDSGKSEGGQAQGGEKKSAGTEEREAPEQQEAPAASEEESAARNRPGAVDALVAGRQVKPEDRFGQEKPAGSPAVSGKGTQDPGPFSRLDGVRNQDLDPEEKAEEDPFGSGSESEAEVGGGEKSAWDIKLQPEDFLPEQDLDVSGVPTADTLDPSSSAAPAAPSFPAPPVTKADKVQAERDAEDAEDAAAEQDAEAEPDDAQAGAEPEPELEESAPATSSALALEQAASTPPAPGSMSKDPKSGADPKAGPVAAQTAVQEAPGKSEDGSYSKEAAAKEEKGTPAAGDKAGAGQQKSSPQAAGGAAAGPGSAAKQEQRAADSAPAGRSEPAADAQGSSPARDSHVSGGSNADRPGVTTSDAAAGTQSGSSDGGRPTPAEPPAPEAPAPAAPEPVKASKASAAAPAPRSGAAPRRETAPKQAPAPRTPRGGGGGGGGKASVPAKGKKDSAPAPNLSGVAPEAGLATASQLKPHIALQAMGGVSGSVDRTVGDEHKALAAAPPSMQRPAGAPQTLEGKPKADAPAQYSQDPAQKSEAPKDEQAEVTGAKEPEGQIEAEKAEEPGGWDTFKMALGFGIGKVLSWVGFEVDAQELAAKFAGLPTKDEALKQAQAGNAPGVEMQGAAEQTAGEQGAAVDAKGQEAVATGRDDAGRPMGEDQVYPNAPKEQMKGKVPGRQGGQGGAPEAGAPTGAVPPEAASAVAEHDRGPQFQKAFGDGQKGMSGGRQTKDRDFRDSQQKHKQKVDAEIASNTESQAGEREKAMSDVTAQRADWRTEQDAELKKLGTKKTERHEKVRKDVKDKEEKTDEDVTKEKEDGDKKIKDENTKAERDAEKQRDDSVQESGNWVTKAFDWIKQKVIEIKNAIVRVIRAARDAVIGFIRNFKETVERWINEARKFIVDTIKNLINDLIEFAKAMVRAVIELANRIRNFITDLIAAAIALVNKLATMLKQIISDLLNAIAKILSDILNILKKMLSDVIKAVVDAIKTVLDYAAKLLSALGDFMLIAVDFLSDPGGWLSGAKNSAVDGAKNHLFREVQAAVKSWFQSKIEEIIGVPKAILDKLIKGGITLEQIVKETWDAIVPQLPFIIGEIVITKVIAKLIPGAGWAMAVIDAIRVAIGALGEILRAIGAVITWLKAVRQGGAGVLFAKAVAAGIVALLELAYEALLSGIGKYVTKVGQRLKGVAANLGKDKGPSKTPAATPAAPGDKGGPGKDQPAPTAPARPTTPSPRPTTPRPGPGTRPGPGKNTPAPGKPGPGTQKTPTDGKRPTGPGKPKDTDTTKPDTRPTSPAKPKPTPAPPPKPKPDTAPTPKPKEDAPTGPKNDQDTTPQPKPTDKTPTPPKDTDPTRPKDTDPSKPKDTDPTKPKDTAPTKPKTDKDGPGKPAKPKDGDGNTKPRTDADGPARPRPDKSGPGRPKSPSDKDSTKKDENSQDSKEDRLRRALARIRPRLQRRLDKGIPEPEHLRLLAQFSRWYRLTSLYKKGGQDFKVWGRLNPEADSDVHGITTSDNVDQTRPDELPGPEISPATKRDDPTSIPYAQLSGSGLNIPSKEVRAKFLDSTVKGTGERPNKDRKQPLGWEHILNNGMSAGADWVKMHLLPGGSSKGLGGHNGSNNLVPARGHRTNDLYHREIEGKAYDDIPKEHKMIWYDVDADFGHPDYPGFPSKISVSYGGYRKVSSDRSGKSPNDWTRKDASLSFDAGTIPAPDKNEKKRIHINSAGEKILSDRLKISYRRARFIAGTFEKGETKIEKPTYTGLLSVKKYLQKRQKQNGTPTPDAIREIMQKIKSHKRDIDWTV